MAENNFANWAERAIGPSMTPTERATIWATLAVAHELKRIADALEGARRDKDEKPGPCEHGVDADAHCRLCDDE
jgi:hypothetical protein